MSTEDAYIITETGQRFTLTKPAENKFYLEDGAAALSRTCRFGGQLSSEFENSIYSVAQHSCYVYDMAVSSGLTKARFWALMHDFCEAYYGDTILPLKRLFPLLEEMENIAARTLCDLWGIPRGIEVDEAVFKLDQEMGFAEAWRLKGESRAREMYGADAPLFFIQDVDPYFHCWSPSKARREYKKRYYEAKRYTMDNF